MRDHRAVLNHEFMDPTPARYVIWINGHAGATVLSAFPALAWQRHGARTVLTGLLDRSALYGVLAEIEALGPAPQGPTTHAGTQITGVR
jgi:hypothetical protein